MRRRALAAGWPPERPPRRIVDKMLRNLWLLGYVSLLLPRSCMLHVGRHPLDAALSAFQQPFGYAGLPWAWRLEHIGQQVRMTAALVEHWRRALPPGRLLTVHYEELVAYPEATARRLLAHCGLVWDPRVLSFHSAPRVVATASVAQVNITSRRGVPSPCSPAPASEPAAIAPEVAAYEAELAEAMQAAEAAQQRLDQEAAAAAAEAEAAAGVATRGAAPAAGHGGGGGATVATDGAAAGISAGTVRAAGSGERGRRHASDDEL
ncbi:hypothetical protein GPECTOR_47g380 [Gonium pectorale]|uniref:protein-tyrosine sulfotransferase n=1 Tax=Gonium pectorale TaxID=33097 RepID=A0A150G8L3_GONPE|nr:hypothetical protein GPECTOR_47g380 [Gonium pectorale]|eukprot:KXZ46103.1 hypothetical protein GPECTOR_47g380 [Gonium pectorale]